LASIDSLLNSASENQDKGRYNSFWTLRLSGIQIDGGLRPIGRSTRKAVSWQVLCQKSVSFKGAVSQERAGCKEVKKKVRGKHCTVLCVLWSQNKALSLTVCYPVANINFFLRIVYENERFFHVSKFTSGFSVFYPSMTYVYGNVKILPSIVYIMPIYIVQYSMYCYA
jgi:hypothetical protein